MEEGAASGILRRERERSREARERESEKERDRGTVGCDAIANYTFSE
jgi:hypothetical protein